MRWKQHFEYLIIHQWHLWFAWYPVSLEIKTAKHVKNKYYTGIDYVKVWFVYVWRKREMGGWSYKEREDNL